MGKVFKKKNIVLGLIIKDKKILLEKRKKKEDYLNWVFPGGEVESTDKDEKSALEREVYEETGIKCKVVRKLGNRESPISNRKISYYTCKYIEGIPKAKKETKEVRWMEINEFKEKLDLRRVYFPVRKSIEKLTYS